MKIGAILVLGLMCAKLSAHELQVNVTLTPAGNFEAKNAKLRGEVKVEGTKYTAEQLWLKTDDFKTGIDLRDEHFKKHLNLSKFPKITFSKIVAENGSGSGMLAVNGQEKKVDFTYKVENPKKIIATIKTKNSLFGLPSANYMGIGVNDDVEVIATIEL